MLYNHSTPAETAYFNRLEAQSNIPDNHMANVVDNWVMWYDEHPDDILCPYTFENFCTEQNVDMSEFYAELDARYAE